MSMRYADRVGGMFSREEKVTRKKISVAVREDYLGEIDELAEYRRMSRSALIGKALDEYLERHSVKRNGTLFRDENDL